MFNPSRNLVLALASYVALAFVATVAAGDLGDVGFWIVWIPVVAIVLYLPAAGVRRAAGAFRERSASRTS